MESLEKVTLSYGDAIIFAAFDPKFYGNLYKETESGYDLVASVEPVEINNWTAAEYKFSEPIVENGTYKFVIPQGAYGDFDYIGSVWNGNAVGVANPEITLIYKIDSGSGIDSVIGAGEAVDVYSLQGVVGLRGADAAAVNALPSGLYIINGKKVMVRK